MNVTYMMMSAMMMQIARIHLELITVSATRDMQEMVLLVKVPTWSSFTRATMTIHIVSLFEHAMNIPRTA
jgi:hypothetical protein